MPASNVAEHRLSVAEIDDLMAIFKGGRKGAAGPSEVENLDLNQTVRIPRGILETLTIRHEQAARTITESLRTVLRTDVTVTLAGLEQDLFGTFKEALEEPCCGFAVQATPIRHPVYLVLDHAVAFACLDRLLGGEGAAEGAARELTPTEVAVLGDVLQAVLRAHAAVWQRYVPLEFQAIRAVGVPRFLREVRAVDPVLVATYRLGGFAEGMSFRVAVPLPGLEGHLQYSRREQPELPAEKKSQARGRIFKHLAGVGVGVTVCFGGARLRVRDVVGLAPGDVIVLDQKVSVPLDLHVEGRPKFNGFLHASSGRYLFRVAREVREAADAEGAMIAGRDA